VLRDRGSAALLSIGKFPVSHSSRPSLGVGCHLQCLLGFAGSQSGCDVAIASSVDSTRLANFTRALIDFQTATQTCILLVPFQRTQDLAIAKTIVMPDTARFFVWKIDLERCISRCMAVVCVSTV